MDSQIDQIAKIRKDWYRYRELMPDVADVYDSMQQIAYAGGRLDAKTKRIIAVAIAVTHGCTGCMLGQTDMALEQGADAEEILEACAVAIAIDGSKSASKTAVVTAYLEERGIL